MNHPAEQAASYGMGYAASGTALGTAGYALADQMPMILQWANLALVAVSLAVGILTAFERIRKWRREIAEERKEAEDRRIQRAALRHFGVPVEDTDI